MGFQFPHGHGGPHHDPAAFVRLKPNLPPMCGIMLASAPAEAHELSEKREMGNAVVRAGHEASQEGGMGQDRQVHCIVVRQVPHGVKPAQARADEKGARAFVLCEPAPCVSSSPAGAVMLGRRGFSRFLGPFPDRLRATLDPFRKSAKGWLVSPWSSLMMSMPPEANFSPFRPVRLRTGPEA